MKQAVKAFVVALASFLLVQAAFAAGETEVTVTKGQVVVETEEHTIPVAAGQKAVMKEGEQPVTTVDDPLVADLLVMDRWIQEEKATPRERVDFASAQVMSIDSEERWKGAAVADMPNMEGKATVTLSLGFTTNTPNGKFYEMGGRVLAFDIEKTNGNKGYYRLHLPEPVPADGRIKFITVDEYRPSERDMWKEGPVWNLEAGNPTPCCLNYFRILLPPSAILLDSTMPVAFTEDRGGRTALTMRNYTGRFADGTYHVQFVWPEKDGTSMEDVPREYRGVQDERVAKLTQEYREAKTKILAGLEYKDLSTPVRSFLTWQSAIARGNVQLYLEVAYTAQKDAARRAEVLKAFYQDPEERKYWFVDQCEFLSTPAWPAEPKEGQLHPVYVSRPGCLIREDMHGFIYHEGKWLRIGNEGNPRGTDVNVFEKYK
jgi:hypothetical protein